MRNPPLPMPPPAVSQRRIIVAGIAGNAMEWYDFSAYGYFAPIIGQQFFPAHDETASLLAAFGVFAAGFLMRPIGAVLFGHIGDRVGRKTALTLSIAAMAVPTFLMGLLPTHQQIGVAATLLMVALRLLQGLSVGGEYGAAIAFLVESAPAQQRGRRGSWTPAGGLIGIIFGSAVAAAVSSLLPPDIVAAWGWRVPFLLGLAVGVVGLYVRRRIPETLVAPEAGGGLPIVEAFNAEYASMLRVFGMGLNLGVGFYMTFVYTVTYLQEHVHVAAGEALDINTLNMVLLLLTTLAAGALSDRIGRRPLLIGGAVGMLVLAYPLFWLVSRPDAVSIFAGQMGFALLLGIYLGPLPAAIAEAFPRRVRCSGMSLAYNLGQAVFGGTTPMVATYLIARSHDDLAPAFYVIAVAAASLAAVVGLPETARQALRD